MIARRVIDSILDLTSPATGLVPFGGATGFMVQDPYFTYSNGRLGIGTASPSNKLDVVSINAPVVKITDITSVGNAQQPVLSLITNLVSGSIVNGFGSEIRFTSIDSSGNSQDSGAVQSFRDTFDNNYRLRLRCMRMGSFITGLTLSPSGQATLGPNAGTTNWLGIFSQGLGGIGIGPTYFNTAAPADGIQCEGDVLIGRNAVDRTLTITPGSAGTNSAILKMGTTTREWEMRAYPTGANYALRFNWIGTSPVAASGIVNLTSAGNVGIGGINPTFKLQVDRAVKIDDTNTNNPYVLLDDGTRTGYLQISSGLMELIAYSGGMPLYLTAGASAFFAFRSNGIERVRLTTDGNFGISTSSPTSTLHISGSVAHKVQRVATTPYTAGAETVLLVDATVGNITINLPAAAGSRDRIYHIKKIDSTVNTVTIDGSGSETIDDSLTVTIPTQYESMQIVCDGSAWWII